MAGKLNSMRLLETHGVAYEALSYSAAIHDAREAGQALGVPVHHVYKTLVVADAKSKPLLVMVAADRQLDLKKCAAAIGQKRVEMVRQADAERLTGLKVGGIGALALAPKRWPVYLDSAAMQLAWICVSAGQRGLLLRVAVPELIRVLGAMVVEAT